MGSGHLGCELDLLEIEKTLTSNGASINSQSEGMLTTRLEEDGPAITLYRSGSFQVRGSPDPVHLHKTADQLLTYLEKIGVPLSEPTFDHKTSVFLANLDQNVDLNHLVVALGLDQVEYEPEQFPALIFRPENLGISLLVFSTGKIIVSGTTEEDIAAEGVNSVLSAVS